MTIADAACLLRTAAGVSEVTVSRSNVEEIYRRACANTYPDVDGDAEKLKRVQEAKNVLDRHFGRT